MPTFLPGPGPLAPAPHSDLLAVAVADAWASTVQSTIVRNYHGSYSAVSGAADEAIPSDSTDWASNVNSHAVAFYRPPPSIPLLVADNSPAALDSWAATTFGRSVPYYKGSAAITISVWDPATNTFADWTPAALLSRAVANYKAPSAQTQVAWGQSIVTDAPAPLASSRPSPLYRAPLAFLANVYDQPSVIGGTSFVATILSRTQPFYRGSYSAISGAADEAIPSDNSDWASSANSRVVPFYSSARSLVTGILFAQATLDAYAPGIVGSRQVASYRGSPSSLWASWDDHACTTLLPDTLLFPDSVLFPDLCAQVELAYVTQSRPVGFYGAPRARITNVYDPSLNTFADWVPRPAIDSPVAFYRAPLAQPVVAWGASIVTDAYAPVALDGIVPFYSSPRSLVIGTFDQAPPGTWANATQSFRPPLRYLGSASLVFNVYDPRTNTFADWTPGALISRVVAFYRAPNGRTVAVFPEPTNFPSAGGGHTFILRMRDPFTEKQGKPAQATNPFVDPFTMKKPKGVR